MAQQGSITRSCKQTAPRTRCNGSDQDLCRRGKRHTTNSKLSKLQMPECIPTPRTHSNSSVVECCHCHRLHIEGAYGVAKQICCKVADAVPGLGPGPASKIVMRLVQQSASQVLTVEASCVHHGCTGLACLQKPFLRYSQAHKTQLHACSAATCFTCVGCRRMLCAPRQHHGCTGPACLQMLYLQHHKHTNTASHLLAETALLVA